MWQGGAVERATALVWRSKDNLQHTGLCCDVGDGIDRIFKLSGKRLYPLSYLAPLLVKLLFRSLYSSA